MTLDARARGELGRLIRRYHHGEVALDDARIERRLFARVDAAELPLGETLLRVGVYKFDEDARYDVIRTALSLLPGAEMSLLDIGSGSGRLLLYAGLLGARRAHGIEILEHRAARARAAAARLALDQVTVGVGDALQLTWPRAEVVVLMNPFYPDAYNHACSRLLDYVHAVRPLILCGGTILEEFARDPRLRVRSVAPLDWTRLGLLELR